MFILRVENLRFLAFMGFAFIALWSGDLKAQGLEALADEPAPIYLQEKTLEEQTLQALPDIEDIVPSAGTTDSTTTVVVEKPMLLEKESAQPVIRQQIEASVQTAPQQATSSHNSSDDVYVLGADDVIKVIVYGENDLSSSYKIGATGSVSFPLIGDINLQGKTVKQVETLLKDRLSEGYLVNPSVVVEVTTYRPFFILGEVRQPGSYDYSNGVTVLKAVALAGGFTYRANKKQVQILTTKNKSSNLYEKVPVTTPIGPGDIILVKERFF